MQRDGALKDVIYNNHSKQYRTLNGLQIRKINMQFEDKDVDSNIQKVTLGNPSPHRPTKIILLVGATGAGKTTLINVMVNNIFGINFKDNFRFILIDDDNAPKKSQTESQTDLITAYAFNHMDGMPFGYNYVLIDTPGFGDTRGIERDQQLMNQLEKFLKQSSFGIDQVHCVGFVVKATTSRLTQEQSYVLNGITSMFGKDIGNNIYIMATFADSNDTPVLDALKAINIQYSGCYTFNNATGKVSSQSNSDDEDDEDDIEAVRKIYWKKGYKSMDKLFKNLDKITPCSLVLTKDVLERRRKLQHIIVGLLEEIQYGLGKLMTLHQERGMLEKVNCEVKDTSNYTEEVDVPKNETETVTTNDSLFLLFFFWNNKKTTTIQKPTVWVKEKRTVQQLFDRYNLAIKDKDSKTALINDIEKNIALFMHNLVAKINEAKEHVKKLEEIAYNSNPISTKEYIEILIENEKQEKRVNFLHRIKMLELLNSQQSILTGVKELEESILGDSEGLLNYFQNKISKNK